MTWTYASNFSLSRDKVRWLVGDTDTNDQLVTDEEIAFALTEDSNVYTVAASVCESIAMKVGARLTVNANGSKIDADEQYKHWMDRASSLREKAVSSGVASFAGGLSIAGKDAVEDDTDRVAPSFTRSLFAGGLANADPESLLR
jgi:hypothetical protein